MNFKNLWNIEDLMQKVLEQEFSIEVEFSINKCKFHAIINYIRVKLQSGIHLT